MFYIRINKMKVFDNCEGFWELFNRSTFCYDKHFRFPLTAATSFQGFFFRRFFCFGCKKAIIQFDYSL
jgi:hypothetical protein